ncbi:Cytochrome bd-I oxidase subunit I [Ignavibacterium album JCM 16511]|uniref:Cytochrome bd-I oxidase subunit I n=1 Tax=Ignavibacterium album (strain DSM 19864 / JCM 16511 / NBRC 101810 / Mat9-16) TaxID=945713 RepID=I0AGM5_IGNAJ|nr:cytochrome ubiquinol oxidase subunit I [Ignavibacterium album]AFH48132.1 Cytochrome bd-I oxidase subunit I [Ignavibacterium album JCM 16511]
MDVEILSRLQFAVTIAFHYIYPPLSIGLGVFMVITEGMYLKTKDKFYEQMTKFWVKVFALTFAIGVATGIVMEFEFGTNWATYSRFVGDVFGSALAAEGIFAFFLESGFLAVLVFGWDKVGPKMHFFSTLMVALGSMFSAIWIVVANSWMQTPAGYHIVGEGLNARAEITDFWAMVFNPSSVDRLLHTISGCWLAGAFLVISVASYYLLKDKHIRFAKSSIKIALVMALIASLFQLFTGHQSAVGVAKNQPAKLAAMEAVFNDQTNAPLYLFGWVNEDNQEVKFGIAIPSMLSYLIGWDANTKVTGLNSFPEDERPPVNIVFQAYHLMVAIGFMLIAISVLGVFLWWKGTLFKHRWLLWVFVFSVLLPQIANQVGWITAEVGRQPWIVYGLMKTSEGLSKAVQAGQVWYSLIMFTLIYIGLFILFIYLLNNKIQHGPEEADLIPSEIGHPKA